MDVTHENFEEAAGQLQELLKTCKFVAFDEEMTGIMLDHSTAPAWGDTVPERYAKMKRVAEHFMLMQVGLCVFHEEDLSPGALPLKRLACDDADDIMPEEPRSPSKRLVARPFNFYVFPSATNKVEVRMKADTAHFHVDNHMDFNKWIKQGVPYLTADDYDAACMRLESEAAEGHKTQEKDGSQRRRVSLSREADVCFIERAFAALRKWLHPPPFSQLPSVVTWAGGVRAGACQGDKGTPGGQGEFVMPDCNPFLRRALYEGLEQHFPDLWAESREIPGSHRKKMVVVALTEEQREAKRRQHLCDKLEALDQAGGFVRIWKMLCDAKKPVVGHNCLFDLLFLFSHFQGTLPPTCDDFKAALSGLLPVIWDTKHLASQSGGRHVDTALGPLYEACTAAGDGISVVFGDGFAQYDNAVTGGAKGPAHEAAFDAYMTGVVWASLMADGEGAAVADKHNHLYLMRSLFCLNLHGPDAVVEQGVLVHIAGFDKRCSTHDLIALFADSPPQIRWINDSSCIACWSRRTCGDEEAAQRAFEAALPAVAARHLPAVIANIEERIAAQAAALEAAGPAGGPGGAGAGSNDSSKHVDMSALKIQSIRHWAAASAAASRTPLPVQSLGGPGRDPSGCPAPSASVPAPFLLMSSKAALAALAPGDASAAAAPTAKVLRGKGNASKGLAAKDAKGEALAEADPDEAPGPHKEATGMKGKGKAARAASASSAQAAMDSGPPALRAAEGGRGNKTAGKRKAAAMEPDEVPAQSVSAGTGPRRSSRRKAET